VLIRTGPVLLEHVAAHIGPINDGITTVENEENVLFANHMMETTMNKIVLTLAAVAALSSASFAGSTDADSRYPYSPEVTTQQAVEAAGFAAAEQDSKEAAEIRRLDEKNN
jgi:hypothetical protein